MGGHFCQILELGGTTIKGWRVVENDFDVVTVRVAKIREWIGEKMKVNKWIRTNGKSNMLFSQHKSTILIYIQLR